MSEKITRQNFTKEFREDAIKLVMEQGYSCSEAGKSTQNTPDKPTRSTAGKPSIY